MVMEYRNLFFCCSGTESYPTPKFSIWSSKTSCS